MDRYLAIDSGKNATKVAIYDPEKNSTKKLAFLTKIGDGDFSDDSIESGTFLAEMDGKVYKVGKGAKFNAELETSKMTDIHKICTLSAIAMCLSADEENTVHVAIGIPVKEFENVEKRNAYRRKIKAEEWRRTKDSKVHDQNKTCCPGIKRRFISQSYQVPEYNNSYC